MSKSIPYCENEVAENSQTLGLLMSCHCLKFDLAVQLYNGL